MRLAVLKLEAGESDPDLFLSASAQALLVQAGVPGLGWGEGDASLAIRLADAAGPSLEATLTAVRGLMALSRFDEVEVRLAPREDEAIRAPLEQGTRYLRSRVNALHWSGRRTDDALALLDRAADWHESADWRAAGASWRAWILLDLARPASAAAAVEAELQQTDLAPQIRLDCLVALGVARSRLGQMDQCEELEREIARLADELEAQSWETGWARYMVDAMGRVEAARDVTGTAARLGAAQMSAEARGDMALAAGLGMAIGRQQLIRGHAREAVATLEDAIGDMTSGDPRHALALTLSYLARAHALTADAAASADALARAESVAGGAPQQPANSGRGRTGSSMGRRRPRPGLGRARPGARAGRQPGRRSCCQRSRSAL